jgi:hypothetical protein
MNDDIPGRVVAEDPDIIDLAIRSVERKKMQEQDQIAADKEWLDHIDPISDTTPLPEYADLTGLTRTLTDMHLGSKGKKKMEENTQSRSRSSSPGNNTAMTYIAYYKATIAKDFSSKALARSPLPANRELLHEVSEYMVEEMYKRYVMGFSPLLPPLNHPLYPFWVREHQGNYAVTAMLAMEKAETEF